jgi:succinate-semialdehyde dehydrogenase / glutarate-semialdehyde dehydrogenase
MIRFTTPSSARFPASPARPTSADGLAPDTRNGPLANPRRVTAIAAFVADAEEKGAKVATGGKRIGNQGNFFAPTVLTDVPENARIMNEEPFGPVAVMLRFKETDDVLARASKLPFGLASYAFARDAKVARRVGGRARERHGDEQPLRHRPARDDLRRHLGQGFGHQGGVEGLQVYMQSKFVGHLG